MTKVITTDGVHPSERDEFWRHAMSEFLPVTITKVGDGTFEGSIRPTWIGRLLVTETRSTGQEIRRTTRDISWSEAEYFGVAVIARGLCRVSQDDRQAALRPGDCVVYETFRPAQWLFQSSWDACAFAFPCGTVPLSDSERRLMTARRLDGRAGISGVVSRFLLDLARNSEDLPAEQSERVLTEVSDLVVALLSGWAGQGPAVHGCVQRSLMLRIKDYIGQRLCDPALGPLEIAAAVNISTRYLHKLFEAEHLSVSQYVKGLRLERSRRQLLDPRVTGRSISAVAFDCGFGDLSGFNRAFKNAYGLTPTELRTAQQRQTVANAARTRGIPVT